MGDAWNPQSGLKLTSDVLAPPPRRRYITKHDYNDGIRNGQVDSYFSDPSTGIAGTALITDEINTDSQQLWARCQSGDIVSSVFETADALLRAKNKLNDAEKWRLFGQAEQFVDLRDALREDPFSNRAPEREEGSTPSGRAPK
jgi:hypothetical protein